MVWEMKHRTAMIRIAGRAGNPRMAPLPLDSLPHTPPTDAVEEEVETSVAGLEAAEEGILAAQTSTGAGGQLVPLLRSLPRRSRTSNSFYSNGW